MPKVSVIVPVYNVESYLPKCLDSLVNQTIDDYEVIVVNDGSPDNSQDIIDKYAEKYPEIIKPFIKENGGLSDARNFGIEKATGEYIAFVDSDDYVSVDMFEKMYNKATKTNADIVYSPILYLYNKSIKKTYASERVHKNSNVKNDPYLLYTASSYAWNKIYRRSFWQKHNFTFPIQAFEDSALIYNVMLCANIISCVNEPLYYYRQQREGAITNQINENIFDIFKSVQSIVDFYKNYLVEEYDRYEEFVEYICVKHLFVRVRQISKCDNKALITEFINRVFDFLETNFPQFRECRYLKYSKKASIKTKFRKKIFKNRKLLILYKTSNRKFRKLLKFVFKKLLKLKKKKSVRKEEAIKETKRFYIQKNGIRVLTGTQELLNDLGIINFADFGTLLGLIRENHLLEHDLDMDIGVIATEADKERIRSCFERNGYKLWRSYAFDDKVVEDSFRYMRIKVDINYYEQEDNTSKTWLFYKEPNTEYAESNHRSIVEMRYSKIIGTKKIAIEDFEVNVPENPEKLLEEKYGESWRTPDTGWIYWQSPAATPIKGIGKFFTYKYVNFPYTAKLEDDLDVKELQKLELTILQEVDRICRENDITYYLGEGTMLGAVRHNGFIPWDDDVDILMPREDYEKFIKIAPEQISKQYAVQHYKLLKNYWSIFMKVRLKDNSVYYQSTLEHLTNDNGPYIDIFPLDRIGDVPVEKLIKNKKKLTFYRKILSYKLKETRPKILKTKLIYPCIFLNSLEKIYRKLEELYHKYDDPNGKYYINYASYYSVKKQVFPISYYGDPVETEFSGLKLYIPQKADAILSKIYGNYMALPPANKRKIKHSFAKREESK